MHGNKNLTAGTEIFADILVAVKLSVSYNPKPIFISFCEQLSLQLSALISILVAIIVIV